MKERAKRETERAKHETESSAQKRAMHERELSTRDS